MDTKTVTRLCYASCKALWPQTNGFMFKYEGGVDSLVESQHTILYDVDLLISRTTLKNSATSYTGLQDHYCMGDIYDHIPHTH